MIVVIGVLIVSSGAFIFWKLGRLGQTSSSETPSLTAEAERMEDSGRMVTERTAETRIRSRSIPVLGGNPDLASDILGDPRPQASETEAYRAWLGRWYEMERQEKWVREGIFRDEIGFELPQGSVVLRKCIRLPSAEIAEQFWRGLHEALDDAVVRWGEGRFSFRWKHSRKSFGSRPNGYGMGDLIEFGEVDLTTGCEKFIVSYRHEGEEEDVILYWRSGGSEIGLNYPYAQERGCLPEEFELRYGMPLEEFRRRRTLGGR